jgi:hypothetical protein
MPHDDDGQDDLFVLAESLPKIRPPSRVKRRLIESAVEIADDDPESLLFQHTVFCRDCSIAIPAMTSEFGGGLRATSG